MAKTGYSLGSYFKTKNKQTKEEEKESHLGKNNNQQASQSCL